MNTTNFDVISSNINFLLNCKVVPFVLDSTHLLCTILAYIYIYTSTKCQIISSNYCILLMMSGKEVGSVRIEDGKLDLEIAKIMLKVTSIYHAAKPRNKLNKQPYQHS